jgi:hypothetical protein
MEGKARFSYRGVADTTQPKSTVIFETVKVDEKWHGMLQLFSIKAHARARSMTRTRAVRPMAE